MEIYNEQELRILLSGLGEIIYNTEVDRNIELSILEDGDSGRRLDKLNKDLDLYYNIREKLQNDIVNKKYTKEQLSVLKENEFDWDKFINKKVAVLLNTEEKYKDFMLECYKRSISWCDSPAILEDFWKFYKENTCVSVRIDGKLSYCEKDYFTNEDYNIIEWDM